ncbi:hypothetical protein ACU19_04805 [Actinobaculum suis]|uniref:type I-E CRISPR-associated protein Cas6/Cse3/CasE n=1 Tax=Actinobaculum suis TaxID=1657 RepID=UPI00066FF2EA|nr:type I-E CRISPR-associated protein Cas6/Cse3/CasE [Actinobaculum suis]KMY23298.1 hypothetical protein ACU19_04805 [Actinobaculum suis]
MAWLTEVYLNRKGTYVYADYDRAHRIFTKITNSNSYLWAAPKRDLLILRTERPVPPEEFATLARSVRAREIPSRVNPGGRYEIAGIVNAVRTETLPNGRKRKMPVKHDLFPAWLERRFGACADLERVTVEHLAPARSENPFIVDRKAFTALATIADAEAFSQLLTRGIGQAKRYGCGLILAKEA